MIRGVFFDAGATLLHADPPVEKIYLEFLRRDGVKADVPTIADALKATWREVRERPVADRYGGVSGEQRFWEFFLNRTRERLDGGAISPRAFSEIAAHFRRPDSWSVYPDVAETLSVLRARDFKLAVVSNWDSTLPALLSAKGLAGSFDAVLVSAVEETGKPDAEIFHRACARVGISAEAARRAGRSALLLDRAGAHAESPERIRTLAEIPPYLGLSGPGA